MDRIAQEACFRQRVLGHYKKSKNVTETGNYYHISRKTVYKWLKRWDGTKESLYDRSRAPHHTRAGHTARQIQLIRRLSKKHHWTDLIAAYQEAVERYGYPYGYQCFKRKVRELYKGKGRKQKKRRSCRPSPG